MQQVGTLTNNGLINVANGGILTLGTESGTGATIVVNNAAIPVTDGNLILGGDGDNDGSITATNSNVDLAGAFTLTDLNLPAFSRTGGTVDPTGAMDLEGGVLSLNATTDGWGIDGDAGNDTLTGGAGEDVFVPGAGDGHDDALLI